MFPLDVCEPVDFARTGATQNLWFSVVVITPILRSVFLPVCVFVSSVIVIFISIKNDAATATVQREEKRRGEEQKERRAKKKIHKLLK